MKFRLYSVLLFLFNFIPLMGFSNYQSIVNDLDSKVQKAEYERNQLRAELGMGIDTDFGFINDSCVYGQIIPINGKEGSVRFDLKKTRKTIEKVFKLSGRGKVPIPIVFGNVSASIEYDSSIMDTSDQESRSVNLNFQLPSLVFKQNTIKLTPLGQRTVKNSPEKIREVCGDSFISQLDIGYKVKISLSILFSSKKVFEQYKAKFKASALGGLLTKKVEILNVLRDIDEQNMRVSFKYFVKGGNVDTILSRFKNKICGLSNIDECLNEYIRFTNFISAKKGGFLDYMRSNKSLVEKNFSDNILSQQSSKYSESAMFDLITKSNFSNITRKMLTARQMLNSKMMDNYYYNSMHRYHGTIDSIPKSRLKIIKQMINENIENIKNSFHSCNQIKKDYSCLEIYEASLTNLNIIEFN